MDDVFNILKFSPTINVDNMIANSIPIQPLPDTINMLEGWDQVSEADIKRHIRFLRLYGQRWALQNLDWTLELLEPFCELGLANKVQEHMIGLEFCIDCGPIYFFDMI